MAPLINHRLFGSGSVLFQKPEPQDERELKRQKRKQSNRESSMRSRMHKKINLQVILIFRKLGDTTAIRESVRGTAIGKTKTTEKADRATVEQVSFQTINCD
ncbi:hypothetical protein M8C21_008092 [Ambrosia artemisiifolia]|uniref:Uncharacterized protein n=1 Tax=Ambrosia artemisiifolia TaxID=4212 RepID=A0AAD5D1E8_AMBAR|nr:hypothetical protein M8C21_008092 [Ambrosia artemisiifolia]